MHDLGDMILWPIALLRYHGMSSRKDVKIWKGCAHLTCPLHLHGCPALSTDSDAAQGHECLPVSKQHQYQSPWVVTYHSGRECLIILPSVAMEWCKGLHQYLTCQYTYLSSFEGNK